MSCLQMSVKYRLDLLLGGSYQVCYSNDSNFSSDTVCRPENPHAFHQSMFVISTVPIQLVCISLSRSTTCFVKDSVCRTLPRVKLCSNLGNHYHTELIFKVCTKRGYSFPHLRWTHVRRALDQGNSLSQATNLHLRMSGNNPTAKSRTDVADYSTDHDKVTYMPPRRRAL